MAVAVGLAAFCILVGRKQPLTFPEAREADLFQAFVIAATCLPLAAWRPVPASAAIASSLGSAVYLAFGYTGGPILLVPLLAMYLAGRAVSRAQVFQLVVAYVLILVVAAAVTPAPATQAWVWVLAWPALAAALALGGNAVHRHEVDTMARSVEEELRQHAEARRQLAEARLQMARDLHDVLGHSLASITILAGAGSRRVEADPDAAREVLDEIRAVSATALADVREALSALNDPTRAIVEDSRADLDHLIARLRRVGLRIDEHIDIDWESVDPAVATALHRIAQESLTNVMRHAGSLHATVEISRVADGVEMVVADRGTGGRAIVEGVGISGMRRRAEELGGRLSVGPTSGRNGDGATPDPGVSVVAWLPLATEAMS